MHSSEISNDKYNENAIFPDSENSRDDAGADASPLSRRDALKYVALLGGMRGLDEALEYAESYFLRSERYKEIREMDPEALDALVIKTEQELFSAVSFVLAKYNMPELGYNTTPYHEIRNIFVNAIIEEMERAGTSNDGDALRSQALTEASRRAWFSGLFASIVAAATEQKKVLTGGISRRGFFGALAGGAIGVASTKILPGDTKDFFEAIDEHALLKDEIDPKKLALSFAQDAATFICAKLDEESWKLTLENRPELEQEWKRLMIEYNRQLEAAKLQDGKKPGEVINAKFSAYGAAYYASR